MARKPTASLAGPAYMIAAAFMMAVVGVSVKWATHDLPTPVVVFFRNFFGLVALAPWLLKPGGISVRTQRMPLHVLRCVFGLCAMFSYFAALSVLPLAQAIVLNFTSPLFIPFIARAWLGEPLSRRVLGAAVLGFIGIVVIKSPQGAGLSGPSMLALLSAFFASLALVTMRKLTSTEPAGRIVFYFALGSTVGAAAPLLWAWQTPLPRQWVPLFLTGAAASLAQLLLSRGYARCPAAVAAVFQYLTVPTAALFGWLLWDERLGTVMVAGSLIICAAGILASWPSRKPVAVSAAPSAAGPAS